MTGARPPPVILGWRANQRWKLSEAKAGTARSVVNPAADFNTSANPGVRNNRLTHPGAIIATRAHHIMRPML